MENKKVPELRNKAKRLGLKRYSRLRKQDLIELFSYASQFLTIQSQRLMLHFYHKQDMCLSVLKLKYTEKGNQRNWGNARIEK